MVSSAPVTTIYYNATNVAAPVGSRPLLLSRVSLSFSPSLCVSYIHRPRPSSHAKSFTSYITQWGGGSDDVGEFRFDAHPQTENVCVHSTAHCTLTSSSSCFTTTASFIIILAGVFLPCVRDGGNAQLFFSLSSPHFFLFLFYCSVYYFVIFLTFCVCVCVTTLRLKKNPETSAKQQLLQPQIYIVLKKKKQENVCRYFNLIW